MKITMLLAGLLLISPVAAQEVPSKESQLHTALLPLPEEQKGDARVYGYNQDGELVVIREGSGKMVCVGDDPAKEGISVACYAAELEPFMQRGRELSSQGKNFEEKFEIRKEEIEEGSLLMPEGPSMMYVYYGKDEDYNPGTGELENGKFRYVIYIPFATPESTGLPVKPHAPGMPWIMDPGTHRAHIMVGPF